MECPGCDKEGAYIEDNGYELRGYTDGEGNYRCRGCGEVFWY
jgi:hypothetical protein